MNEKMNKRWVLFHLHEAKEALEQTISEIKSDPEYEFGNYTVDVGHVYHHLNTAWNSRNAPEEQAERSSEDDFYRWRQFPDDDDRPLM